MERMTLKEIAAAIGADGTFEGAVDCVSTDTRALPPGCLFVALEGERFDGHDYITAALRGGQPALSRMSGATTAPGLLCT